MNLMFNIIKIMATQFNNLEYSIIEEEHHKSKKDCPSGTALVIKDIITNLCNLESDIKSYRTNQYNATNIYSLEFPNISILVAHKMLDRTVYIDGIIKALQFINNKQYGYYLMNDIMNF